MTSTPSVPQYMPSICQNIDVSRHVLVYRYIHDRANRMVENTTIRSYRCVCDSQMQRPGVIILLFEKKQTRVWELATRLFLLNAPLTVRYVYDGASYCTYRTVLPPFRFIGLNSKISPTKMVSGGIFFVVLQKHLINALVFLKKLCLSMH